MKRKLIILIGALFLAMAVSVGSYAYTYNIDSARLLVAAAGGGIAASGPAAGTPDWESVVPVVDIESEILLPNASGDQTSLEGQYPSDGDHWEKVSDLPSDDWDSYVYTTDKNYARDLYRLTDRSEGFGTIKGVVVYFRFAGSDFGGEHAGYAKAAIKTGNKVFHGSEETAVGQTFVNSLYRWTVNPETNEAWTWDEVDDLQAGVALMGESNKEWPVYCTQVYVEVEYEMPPVIEGDLPTGNLFVISPHPEYTGDLLVKLYLINTGDLINAYQYLNIKLYVDGSVEAEESPDYQMLSLENGVALFNIEGGRSSYTIEVIGGSYRMVSAYSDRWKEVWSATPEFYCEVSQR